MRTIHLCVLIHIHQNEESGWYCETCLSLFVIFLTDRSKEVLLLWVLFFVICACIVKLSCWERADLLALFYVMLSCDFVTFPYGVLGQVWNLIVSIPVL